MYEIFCDNQILYKPNEKELVLINPKLSLEINNAGSFQFSIPSSHPMYDQIKKFTSYIEVKNDGETVFCGRPVEENIDFFKNKTIYCEGELAFLNDSIQRPSESHDITVRGFLELLINNHNSQVDASKQFTVGTVTVTDSNDSLYRYTNYENTLTAIKEKLVDRLEGFLVIRHVNGVRYIDYLKELPNTCTQTIEFGQNLLDYASNIDATDIATRLIPLGAKLEESQYTAIDERVTIKSVNNGFDYVQSDDAVAKYGIVTKVQEWDDVNEPSILKKKGQEYLETIQWESMTLNVTTVDLHALDANVESIKIGDKILAVSKSHGLKKYFPVQKMEIDLFNPENNKFKLGTSYDVSISTKSNSVEQSADQAKNIPMSSVLQSAKKNASEMIKMATNGFIVLHMSESGNPDELLVMDTPDIKTATKVWRWNVNGLGYSNTGYNGEYGLAMTMDGAIVADRVTTGTMLADRINGGTFSAGGDNNKNGIIQIKDASGNVIGKWTKDGIEISKGSIVGSSINVGGNNNVDGEIQVKDASGNVIGKWTKDGIEILSGTIKGVSIESNNAKITGGLILMETDDSEKDFITLNYIDESGKIFKTQLSSTGLSVGYENGFRTGIGSGAVTTYTQNGEVGSRMTSDIISSKHFGFRNDSGSIELGNTGTFIDKNGKTVTVKGGIITSIS